MHSHSSRIDFSPFPFPFPPDYSTEHCKQFFGRSVTNFTVATWVKSEIGWGKLQSNVRGIRYGREEFRPSRTTERILKAPRNCKICNSDSLTIVRIIGSFSPSQSDQSLSVILTLVNSFSTTDPSYALYCIRGHPKTLLLEYVYGQGDWLSIVTLNRFSTHVVLSPPEGPRL